MSNLAIVDPARQSLSKGTSKIHSANRTCQRYSIQSLASSSNDSRSTLAKGSVTSEKGSDKTASDEYGNLDRRHSSSAIGRGSMPTPVHHDASSP